MGSNVTVINENEPVKTLRHFEKLITDNKLDGKIYRGNDRLIRHGDVCPSLFHNCIGECGDCTLYRQFFEILQDRF